MSHCLQPEHVATILRQPGCRGSLAKRSSAPQPPVIPASWRNSYAEAMNSSVNTRNSIVETETNNVSKSCLCLGMELWDAIISLELPPLLVPCSAANTYPLVGWDCIRNIVSHTTLRWPTTFDIGWLDRLFINLYFWPITSLIDSTDNICTAST